MGRRSLVDASGETESPQEASDGKTDAEKEQEESSKKAEEVNFARFCYPDALRMFFFFSSGGDKQFQKTGRKDYYGIFFSNP